MKARDWTSSLISLIAVAGAVATGCGKDDSRTEGCSSDQTECSGECVDLDYDPDNCGSCGNSCGDLLCDAGQCSSECSGNAEICDGACVDLNHDPDNCGECGNSCDGLLCDSGECSLTCGAGTVTCGGTCVNLDFDPQNCGECGNDCGDELCDEGMCSVTCGGGRVACSGICTETNFDPSNCGTCGNECDDGQVCSDGACGALCTSGTTRCGDLCVDTESNDLHCGRCDEACESGDECVAGQCVLDCGTEELCDGACIDTDTDPDHCGNCVTACDPGDACVDGDCVLEGLQVTALEPPATFTPGGLKLNVMGQGLDGSVTVSIDGQACESPTPSAGGTSLTCIVQAHAAGLVDVVISRGTDVVTLEDSFTYRDFTRVDTIIGTGVPGVTNGTGDIAQVSASVNDLVVIGDTLYFNDGTNYQVRSANLSGLDLSDVQASDVTVQVLAGSGTQGRVDSSTASEVDFLQPEGMTVIGSNLYVADTDWEANTSSASVIRRVTLASGSTTSPIFGALSYSGISAAPNGVIYAADCTGDSIQRIDTNDANSITTWVGAFADGGDFDAVGNTARLNCPYGVEVDRLGEYVYFTDWNNQKIKRAEISSRTVSTLAGTGTAGAMDGAGTSAQFRRPNKLSVSPDHLFIADMLNCTVRMMELDAPYTVSTLAGQAQTCVTADGTLGSATLASPVGIHYSPKYGVFVGTGDWGYFGSATPGNVIQLIH